MEETSYQRVISLAAKLIVGNDALQERYTKAESKRQRSLINQIQKVAVQAKKDLIASDNAE